MTRVSEYFGLGGGQASLDFVDIDVTGDSPVYIDPHAIRTQIGPWIESCQIAITGFFDVLLDSIRVGDKKRQLDLVRPLSEPNETHLGESRGDSKGRSLGSEKRARDLIDALSRSRAVKSGLLTDLEETILFVDGIGVDILSDITTCLIRNQLIEYTQSQCRFQGIEMHLQFVDRSWNAEERTWEDSREELLPRGPLGPLVFVPRSMVRFRPTLDKDKYFRGYLRPYYEEQEIAKGAASEFVHLIAKGTKHARLKVDLGKLDQHLGTTKAAMAKHTDAFPEALEKYRVENSDPQSPIDNETLAAKLGEPQPDLTELLEAIDAIRPGKAGATSYHRAVLALFSALFATSLGNARMETPLHDGRKRVDITYDNVAGRGFFAWLSQHYPCAMIVVECKNYEREPGNPEVDQISGRFSPDRGMVGILTVRKLENRDHMAQRCKSTASDRRGYVIALEDRDLEQLVADFLKAKESGNATDEFPLLRRQFGLLIGDA